MFNKIFSQYDKICKESAVYSNTRYFDQMDSFLKGVLIETINAGCIDKFIKEFIMFNIDNKFALEELKIAILKYFPEEIEKYEKYMILT